MPVRDAHLNKLAYVVGADGQLLRLGLLCKVVNDDCKAGRARQQS